MNRRQLFATGLTSALGPQNNVKQREVWLLFAWRT